MKKGKAFCYMILWAAMGACTIVKKTAAPEETATTEQPQEITQAQRDSAFLALLLKMPEPHRALLLQPEKYRLQIIYTQIDRTEDNSPVFTHHYFRADAAYTYPASTVKLPAAVLALEKLNKLGVDGLGINSPMFTGALRPGEKPVYTDATAQNGLPSVGHYIRKILLVSDNDAYNRLYEFLGQEPFNRRLHELGFTSAQMTHRLSLPLQDAENRLTNPVWFHNREGKTIYRQSFAQSKMEYAPRNDKIGRAYLKSGGQGQPDQLVPEPLDFSIKNRWSLRDAHTLTQWIMFPGAQPEGQKLLLSASDYQFLWKYMSMLPGESRFPAYDTQSYWPAYVKFLMAGSAPGPWFNPQVRIFNKVGNAYGFLLDAAYVADFSTQTEFLLSAVVYCNSDEVLNDDTYDYEQTGFPFLKALGEHIYRYEQSRPKKRLPDLSLFSINYADQ